jgi:hypothetical protein
VNIHEPKGRSILYIPAEGYVEGHGWRVSLVFENEAGHYPTGNWPYEGKVGQKVPWFYGPTYDEAMQTARAINERNGISALEEFAILSKSMGKQFR